MDMIPSRSGLALVQQTSGPGQLHSAGRCIYSNLVPECGFASSLKWAAVLFLKCSGMSAVAYQQVLRSPAMLMELDLVSTLVSVKQKPA